ncbi:MAG: CvpA family protein [Bacillota bacterium]
MGDLILAVFLVLSVWYGWRKGVVKILAGPGAVIGGIFFARHLVGFAAPLVEAKLQNSAAAADANLETDMLSGLFFSSSFFGHLVEGVLFFLIVGLVVWVFRRLTKTAGDIVNSTPLVGFVCRFLGAVLALLCVGLLIYVAYIWAVPWLAHSFPRVQAVNGLLESSVLILPFIQALGALILDMASYGIAAFDFKTYM